MSQFLKSFLAISLLFVVAFIFLGLLLPKKESITVTKDLKCTPEHVFAQINELKNWESWSAWAKLDPNMKKAYNEIPAGEGASYSWEGNSKVGKGTLTILHSIPNQRIDMNLFFDGQGDAKTNIVIIPKNAGSTVSWTMNLGYPQNNVFRSIFGGYMYLMMKYFLTSDFETGLENLDKTCN